MTKRRYTYTSRGNLLFVQPQILPHIYRVMPPPELLRLVSQEIKEHSQAQADELSHMADHWDTPTADWLTTLDHMISGSSLSDQALERLQSVRGNLDRALAKG